MDEEITITMPMSTFQMAKQFISGFSKVLDAADAKIKADMKASKATSDMDGMMGTGLEGFGQELTGASDQGLGLMQ